MHGNAISYCDIEQVQNAMQMKMSYSIYAIKQTLKCPITDFIQVEV